MNNHKHKSTLLLVIAGLMLTGCDDASSSVQPSQSNNSEATSSSAQNESATSANESSQAAASSSSVAPTTSIDYTAGWSDTMADTLRSNLGGQLIPFIDFPGEVRAVWVDKISSSHYDYSQSKYVYDVTPAHLYIFSSGAFDNNLLYNVKVTYERAGWQVSYNRGDTELTASKEEDGMSLHFYSEKTTGSDFYTPGCDLYYTEPFRAPENGAWTAATISALSSIGVGTGHMLPYTYLGKYTESAVASANQVVISGGDWATYEKQILAEAQKSMPQSKKWSQTNGSTTVSGNKYNTYTFKKSFSDGNIVQAVLTGSPVYTGSYYSQTLDHVDATLTVTCTQR